MLRLSLLLILALSSSGCRHRRATVAGPGMNAKREVLLMESAASRLQCPRKQLMGAFEASLESNYHVYRVDGCGRRFYSLLHCTGICNWREAPEMRAETDLQCPVTQLTRTYTPYRHVFTISGCGQQVSYELGQGHLRPVPNFEAPPLAPQPPGTLPPPPSSALPPPPPPPPPSP